MSKMVLVNLDMTEEQYHRIMRVSRLVLKGRRGLSSKKSRTKKKIFQETITKLLEKHIEELRES